LFAVLAPGRDNVAMEQLQTPPPPGGRKEAAKPEGENTRAQHFENHLEPENHVAGPARDRFTGSFGLADSQRKSCA
jgi:hypothetical protein